MDGTEANSKEQIIQMILWARIVDFFSRYLMYIKNTLG